MGFNSILVRLKDRQDASTFAIDAKFQFHTGSIKSEIERPSGAVYDSFQFHTGSIKSLDQSNLTFTGVT